MRLILASDALNGRPTALKFGLALLALCFPGRAVAQIGASLSLESDYRFRGFSISNERPALSLGVSYDHNSGAYIGGTATAAHPGNDGVELLEHVEYLGYATRTKFGPTLDFGVTNSNIRSSFSERLSLHYNEFYTGLSTDRFSAYIRYSPNYFQKGVDTLYIDINGSQRPADHWRLFGHAGVFLRMSDSARPGARPDRYDIRLGVAREFEGFELRLLLTTRFPQPEHDPVAVVLGATFYF